MDPDKPFGRVAALYDIHGNLPALDAVLQELRSDGVDVVVIGGDVVPGPMPRECMTRLLDLEIPVRFLRGNGDREILALMRGVEPKTVPPQYLPVMRWVAEQLDEQHAKQFDIWPATLTVNVEGMGTVLFCHATPSSDTEIFTRLTSEERLLQLFKGVAADVVVCGHTHMQFDRRIGDVRIVNAGSVGMPFGAPGANWLAIGPEIQLKHASYDTEKAAQLIRGSGYPQAVDFAANNVLRPPSEEQMLGVFKP